jgi:poly(A) polymerase
MTPLPSLKGAAWLEDPALRRVFAAIREAGGEARVAGGAVRNALLGEKVNDIDLATTLTPERVMTAAKAAKLGAHPTGIDHGTVTLVANGQPFEVTTLRRDVETFGRKARVAFTDDWMQDALRRDFTMNALYCSEGGEIFDPAKGYADILRKRIRFVGDPAARIKEDFLRILRFFRFHARYGGAPDRAGLAACLTLKNGLKKLSAERIRQELFKLLVAKRAPETVKLMAKRDLLKVILAHNKDMAPLIRMAKIDAAEGFEPDALLRLVLVAKNALSLRDRLKLTNAEAERLTAIGEHAPTPKLRDSERRIVLYQIGPQAWRDTVRTGWAKASSSKGWRELYRLADDWTVPQFPVKGQDLISRGMKPGPAIGEALTRLEDWWVASQFKPSKDEVLDHFDKKVRSQ